IGASAGTVRIDAVSAGLLEARFAIRSAGDVQILESERREGDAPRTLLGQVTPFVGRSRELTQLDMTFQECVEEGVARVALVTAPAGAGKSRLRYEFVQRLRARAEDFELLIAHGDSVRARTPFGLLSPAIRAAAEIASDDTPQTKREKLLRRVGRGVS